MTGKAFLRDEGGAVTTDWIALSAGIIVLGIVVVYSVMGNSSGYLMDEFETLNEKYAQDAVTVSDLGQSIEINQ